MLHADTLFRERLMEIIFSRGKIPLSGEVVAVIDDRFSLSFQHRAKRRSDGGFLVKEEVGL